MSIPISIDPLGTLGNAPVFQLPSGYDFVPSAYFDGQCVIESPVLANVRSRVRFEADFEPAGLDAVRFPMGEFTTGRYGFALRNNLIEVHYFGPDGFIPDINFVGGYTVIDVDYRVTSFEASVMDSAGTRTFRKEGTVTEGTRNFAIGNRRTGIAEGAIMTFSRMVLSQEGKHYFFLPCKRPAYGTFHIAVGERGGVGQICTALAGTLKESKS